MWNLIQIDGGLLEKVRPNINVAFQVYQLASLPMGATKFKEL